MNKDNKWRWKFSISKTRVHFRAGLFMIEACRGHLQPLANNVSVDEKISGLWLVWLPLKIVPGQSFPVHGWRKSVNIDTWEEECPE